jgi:hypothetical protein
MSDRNAIAQELSVEQLDKFIRELAELPGKQRTLKAIAEKAAALGIEISIMSAKSFRDTTFAKYIKRTERRREFAERIAAAPSTGATFADAAAENLSELVFDMTEELADVIDEGGALDLKKASATAFIISKIRQGDVARGKLQLQVDEYQRKERERAEKTAQAAAQLEKLRDPGAGLNAQERIAVLDSIDDLLGIKKA